MSGPCSLSGVKSCGALYLLLVLCTFLSIPMAMLRKRHRLSPIVGLIFRGLSPTAADFDLLHRLGRHYGLMLDRDQVTALSPENWSD